MGHLDLDFADVGPHPAVIVSHPDRVARAPLVNVLIGSSQKASRPARENEVVLNGGDGLDWETLVKRSWEGETTRGRNHEGSIPFTQFIHKSLTNERKQSTRKIGTVLTTCSHALAMLVPVRKDLISH